MTQDMEETLLELDEITIQHIKWHSTSTVRELK